MTPNDYQKLALKTEKTPAMFLVRENGGPQEPVNARLLHAILGIASELGESSDPLKKQLIYGKPLDPVNVMEELGDKLWYIALGLDSIGYTVEEAMVRNIAKLRVRFPDKFTTDAALVRNLDAERSALDVRELQALGDAKTEAEKVELDVLVYGIGFMFVEDDGVTRRHISAKNMIIEHRQNIVAEPDQSHSAQLARAHQEIESLKLVLEGNRSELKAQKSEIANLHDQLDQMQADIEDAPEIVG